MAKNSRPSKGTSKASIKCTYLISSSYPNSEENYAKKKPRKWKKWEKSTKKSLFWGYEEVQWSQKVETGSSICWRERGRKNTRFSRSKGVKSLRSSLPIDLGGWFLDKLNFKLSIAWLNEENFCVFDPSISSPPIWGITEFLPKITPPQPYVYLIYCPSKPIDRISAILVNIERSK